MAHLPRVGIKRKRNNGADDVTVPEFAMPPEAVPGIAQVIVYAWQNQPFYDQIMERETTGPNKDMATPKAVTLATTAINAAAPNFNLKRAVIISENEHDGGYTADENDVVFVLPNKERVADLTTSATLLNTAKLLMACTPNGI